MAYSLFKHKQNNLGMERVNNKTFAVLQKAVPTANFATVTPDLTL
jgi:hypothetical protein